MSPDNRSSLPFLRSLQTSTVLFSEEEDMINNGTLSFSNDNKTTTDADISMRSPAVQSGFYLSKPDIQK